MKRKGYWAVVIIILLLVINIKGDAGIRPDKKNTGQKPNMASIAVESDAELKEVKPKRIPVGITVENEFDDASDNYESENDETDNNVSEQSDMTDDSSEAQPEDKNTSDTLDESTEDEEQVLTLLTFNIHSANNADGSIQLEQIIEEIKETGAQIIGLQEVERMMPRSGYQDQAKVIAEKLGYYYYYGGNINILGVQYGNAFLSKYPILEASNHKLPREMIEPRGLIEALIDVEGVPYHIYVTHLGLDPEERRKQVIYINDLISRKEGRVLLLGDFNNRPNSREMENLDSRMVDSAAALGYNDEYTYSNWDNLSKVRIDRIYASDNIKLKSHRVMPSLISDHKRVLTQIVHEILPIEGIYETAANRDSNKAER
ncbi:MAG TPA: hypothetical protein GX505_05770 [Clostridiales bacterium]|nr:hypothetical protein [Clostridiales bacterium]